MSKFIKTNISNAYWYTPNDFQQAETLRFQDIQEDKFFELREESKDSIGSISWFDNLFEGGGIKIQDNQGKPIIMLISGPPGSGKTTLALELCLRVAICHGFWSLYISTESETEQLIQKAADLGVKGTQGRINAFKKGNKRLDALTIYGQENIQKWETFSEIVRLAIEDITTWLTRDNTRAFQALLRKKFPGEGIPNVSPDILVFDNLNIVKHEDRHDFFEKIVKGRRSETKLIIVILDASSSTTEHEVWEFACDNIVRLDYNFIKLDETSLRDYYLRYIEVVKARYQGHTSGRHQLKIYSPFNPPRQTDPNRTSKMRRAHPYREEGGIFIYPSIHYYLSGYKRYGPAFDVRSVPTPCKELNDVIGGFPDGRCTAFIGCRGAHKSHFSFLHLLERIINNKKEAGIIVSLRDDEEMTRKHLLRILSEKLIKEQDIRYIGKAQLEEINATAGEILDNILNEMNLEILYYPPGYITADEFFHRMFMSVYRLRNQKRNVTLLFNSLDQISARFPLCAHQPIFVPAMIEALSCERVTSIFIAVDEPGQPSTQYGLLPMSDLILTFMRCKIREEDYYGVHNQSYVAGKHEKRDAIMLEVSRFAGGQQAGTKGLFELVYSDNPNPLINEYGLHFTKWDYEYFVNE